MRNPIPIVLVILGLVLWIANRLMVVHREPMAETLVVKLGNNTRAAPMLSGAGPSTIVKSGNPKNIQRHPFRKNGNDTVPIHNHRTNRTTENDNRFPKEAFTNTASGDENSTHHPSNEKGKDSIQNHNNRTNTTNDIDDNHLPEVSIAFEWSHFDLNRNVSCGSDKCLFRAFSNHSLSDELGCHEIPETGYLVSRPFKKVDESIFDGWKIAHYLVETFGIQHFLLEAPFSSELNRSMAEILFLRDELSTNYSSDLRERIDEVFRSQDTVTVTVQKIAIAPDSSREIRASSAKEETPGVIEERVISLLEELLVTNTTKESFDGDLSVSAKNYNSTTTTLCGTPLPFFLDRLETQVLATLNLLWCEPLLALDFQFIVDSKGQFYHLDFDRVLTQMGGLRSYNQSRFDGKMQLMLDRAEGILEAMQKWIDHRRRELLSSHRLLDGQMGENHIFYKKAGLKDSTVADTTSTSYITSNKTQCERDWKIEESKILASDHLPCLATERVAIARHQTTSTMRQSATAKDKPQRKNHRLRHPLLVALLQRIIEGGFYGKETGFWDCNIEGDRVKASGKLVSSAPTSESKSGEV